MRIALLIFIGLLSLSASGQEKQPDMQFIFGGPKDVWERLSTLEDSALEVNTSTVSWPGNDVGQVRFRYIFNKSQVLEGTKLKYKTQILILDLDCKGRRWRTWQAHDFDSDEKIVYSQEADPDAKWKEIKGAFGGGPLITAAGCRVVSTNSGALIKPGPAAPPSTPSGDKPVLRHREPGSKP